MSTAQIKKTKPRLRLRTRGILVLFAAAFATSGALRLGPVSAAFAEDLTKLLSGTSADQSADISAPKFQDVAVVLAALQEREATLEAREKKLAQRLEALNLAEDRVSSKLEELTKAEETLAATMAMAKTAAVDDLSRLTTLYENMKPKQAIPLFEAMDPDFAAGFIAQMKPATAAQIMAGLDPQKSYAISVVLAGRNAAAPTQ
ncbi:MotE family protein [Aliiroseovarius sp. S253]|uniref:MotE family protein n=1 Tax=Aliiroseovarius sp. S253 TaxID=3415133 RepID=UPI003C7DE3DA